MEKLVDSKVTKPQKNTSKIRALPFFSKKEFLLFSLLSAFCLLVGTNVFLVNQNLQLKKKLSEKPTVTTPTETPLPSPESELTTNWKTYTNEEYNFQFRYPADWEIWSVDGSIDFPPGTPTPLPEKGTNLTFGYDERDEKLLTKKQMQIYLNVIDNPQQLPIKEYFKQASWSDVYLDQMEETTINGYEAVNLERSWNDTLEYFIKFDEYIIDFQLSYFETEVKFTTPPEQILNQILSTFQFLD